MAATLPPLRRRLVGGARRAFSSAPAAAAFPPPLYVTDAATRRVISPWHDVPLRPLLPAGGDPALFNFVCEIPKGRLPPKLEVDPDARLNPVKQDKNKDGSPRFYKLDTLIHYGALPQTFEDPAHKDRWTGLLGDGDPVDVCEVAVHRPARPGSVYRVKVLGALAMIDGGETDWKLLAVRADDPLSAQVSDISDSARSPAALLRLADEVREWFRLYKIPEGKGENSFAFEGRWLGRDTALEVIADTHRQWEEALAAGQAAQAGAAAGGAATKAKKGPWVPASGWTRPAPGYLQGPGEGADLLTGTTAVAP